MEPKILVILTLCILVGCNLVSHYLYSKYDSGEDILLPSMTKSQPPSTSYFSFKYGHENIPKTKKASVQTVSDYLREKGLPTYDFTSNYGDFERIKQYEAHKALEKVDAPDLTASPGIDAIGLANPVDSGTKSDLTSSNPGIRSQINEYKKEIEMLKQQITALQHNGTQDDQVTQMDAASMDMGKVLESNPYRKLGLYETLPKQYYNLGPGSKLYTNTRYYGIIHNPYYCEQVDLYNLIHPENVFETMKFVSDYAGDELLVRTDVMPNYGVDLLPDISALMKPADYTKKLWYLPLNATAFIFKRVNVHHFYEANKEMICLSQIYNHIPGHGVLTRKDYVADSINNYTKKYSKKPQCLQNTYFPPVYRLNDYEECKAFFIEINSQKYLDKKATEPVQYIIKAGFGVHRAAGLKLLLEDEEKFLKEQYENGRQCGNINTSLLAQTYISNPLLLDRQNKFDFRIYMLVASVKPLIVYYHDGFLRLSLSKYDKFSTEKNVHFTNTHLSKPLFEEAGKLKEYQGMSEQDIREYQMWLMTDLQDYLLERGLIDDENWLETQLKPKFKQAFIHIARMSEDSFYKTASVFELFGLDFVMDENLNIWFVECNASPQLIGTSERKADFLRKMLTDMFEIQIAYYQNRMRKVFNFMQKLIKEIDENPDVNFDEIKEEFDEQNTNNLSETYPIRPENGFIRILDRNLEGYEAYLGNLDRDCVEFE